MITRISRPAMLVFLLLACVQAVLGASPDDTRYVTYSNAEGDTIYLKDNRRPALYTGNFGDCLGGSSINVTRFDAAYYRDNMTILFHLEGNSAIANESVVMYIGVYAYGESRFDLTFNPCSANIDSLCPLNSSVPIAANGIIPIGPQDVANVPSLAYAIPDFEGQAILRIFANSTESEIACYSAVVTNGHSFGHPKSIGTLLGILTLVTLIASFGTAIYGEAIPTMRLHYAHSLSVGVVIAVFQHIFFSGALSVNWPAVTVAWWSNFAWSAGMIYSSSMQSSINRLIGNDVGNTSQVGAAPADSSQAGLGGGYDISSIYQRSVSSGLGLPANHPLRRDLASELFGRASSNIFGRDVVQHHVERALRARDTVLDKSDGYRWYGHPVGSGLPLPGNYSGFAGTLAEQGIRVSNAFMTGFLWLLILLVLLVLAVIAFKWTLEGLAHFKLIKQDRLKFFRNHWRRYSAAVALRTCYVAFFLMMFLTVFQFTYQSSAGVKAVAALIFAIFIVGVPGVAAYAVYYRKVVTRNGTESGPNQAEHKKLLGMIPMAGPKRAVSSSDQEHPSGTAADGKTHGKSFWTRKSSPGGFIRNPDDVNNIHDHDDYTMKFGWLASRFRRTRWWFFTVWLGYEFLRAVFYAGASGYALAQVFGLLIIEFLAFAYVIWARPFEGRRLNVIVVYCLGFSKVASVALSAAFDVQFNLPRITTTVIGLVIVIIQGVLTIITMIAIVVGAISSYMSVSRNHEDFRPRKWHGLREKYFNHLDRVVNDLPREEKPKKVPKVAQAESEELKEGFEMKGVRRLAKIEDEDADFTSEMQHNEPNASHLSLNKRGSTPANFSDTALAELRSGTATPVRRSSRPPSVYSQTNLPYGARALRSSWSLRDFSQSGIENQDGTFPPTDMNRTVPDEEPETASAPAPAAKNRHSRSASLTSAFNKRASVGATVEPRPSSDSLHIGGEVSTRDTIGNVPAPTVRPRSASQRSNRNSRVGSPVYGMTDLGEALDLQIVGHRGSKQILTPTQEMDEWRTTPKQSQETTE